MFFHTPDVSERLNHFLKTLFQKTSPLFFCIFIFTLSRIVLFQQAFDSNFFFGLQQAPQNWLLHLDALWYLDIANHGYSASFNELHHANYVFFPLLPLGGFLVKTLLHLPLAIAGVLFTNLLFLGSLLLFYKYIYLLFKEEDLARWGVLLLAFSPFNIYFSSFYTESLFLFLSLSAMLAAYRQEWFWAGFWGMLLSATHLNGFMILVPLIFMAKQHYPKKRRIARFLPLALVPLGLIAFMLYLHFHFGSAWVLINNQEYWGRPGWIMSIFFQQLWANITHFHYNLLFVILSFFLIYQLYRKEFYCEMWYFIAMLLPALLSGSVVSFARFSACLYTFYFALLVFAHRKPYLLMSLLLLEALYFGLCVSFWVNSIGDRYWLI